MPQDVLPSDNQKPESNSARISDYHWEALVTPQQSPEKDMFGNFTFGCVDDADNEVAPHFANTALDTAGCIEFERLPTLNTPYSRRSSITEFPQVPVFRKTQRSMSQPHVLFPSLNVPSYSAGDYGEYYNNPGYSLSQSAMLRAMNQATYLEEDEEEVCDFVSSEQGKRRMSTPAALHSLTLSPSVVMSPHLEVIDENPMYTQPNSSTSSVSSRSSISSVSSSSTSSQYNSSSAISKINFIQQNLSLPTRRHSTAQTDGIYKCPWSDCGKEFTRFYNLKSHYRCHSGEKPFRCEYCDASFARNHDLKRHERKHTGDKPFQCSGCNKTFSRNDAMNRHIRISNCIAKTANSEAFSSENRNSSALPKFGMMNFDNSSLASQIKTKMVFTQVSFE